MCVCVCVYCDYVRICIRTRGSGDRGEVCGGGGGGLQIGHLLDKPVRARESKLSCVKMEKMEGVLDNNERERERRERS